MSWLLRNNEVKKAQVKRNLLLYLEAPGNGGVSRVVELIAERGRERFGICVVASRTPDLADSINNLRNKDIDVRESALRGRFLLPGWIHVPRFARLYSLFRGADIIHFHLHTPFSCMAAILLASVVARKLIITTEHYVTQLKFLRRRKLPFPLGAVREIRIAFLLFVIAGAVLLCVFNGVMSLGMHNMSPDQNDAMVHIVYIKTLISAIVSTTFSLSTTIFFLIIVMAMLVFFYILNLLLQLALLDYWKRRQRQDILQIVKLIIYSWLSLFERSPNLLKPA